MEEHNTVATSQYVIIINCYKKSTIKKSISKTLGMFIAKKCKNVTTLDENNNRQFFKCNFHKT